MTAPFTIVTFIDAAVSPARASFPVLVFIPGGAQKALSYTALLEELTSRGYVIAALELPHNCRRHRRKRGRTRRRRVTHLT